MQENNSVMIWVVIVIIIAVLVWYAFYYASSQMIVPAPVNTRTPVPQEDSTGAIESDLKSMNINSLDSELVDIERSLQ